MRFPAAAPISRKPGTSVRWSPQNSAGRGRHPNGLPSWGRGRQAMHLPCKQAHAGALPADSTIFHCGENEIQESLISSTSVGATPTPATTFREVSRPPGRNPGVMKQAGSDGWSVTSTSHHLDL